MTRGRLAWALAAGLGGCGPVAARAVVVRPGEVLRWQVPPRSRSLTVVLSGAPDVTYWLASLQLAGRELALQQSPRRGTFTFVYPYAPGQPLPAGVVALRVAASRPAPAVRARLIAAPEDGARVLHVNLFAVSERRSFAVAPAFLGRAQALLGQAGIRVRVDSLHNLRGTGLSTIDALTLPWEEPTGPLSRLAALGAARVESDALNVYVVDGLPRGSDGVSLGVPGPPLPGSAYFGVVLRDGDDASLGWAFAHEVAHFLGLRHPRTVTPEGQVLTDGIDDTEPGGDNLMERGARLTPGQAYVLSRSALLKAE